MPIVRTAILIAGILSLGIVGSGCKGDASRRRAHDKDKEEEPSASATGRSMLAQCNDVIDTLNRASKSVQEVDATKDYEEQAKKIEALDKEIADIKVDDPELKKQTDAYRKMLGDFAKLTRDFKDPSKLEGLMKRADDLTKTEGVIVDAINARCRQ